MGVIGFSMYETVAVSVINPSAVSKVQIAKPPPSLIWSFPDRDIEIHAIQIGFWLDFEIHTISSGANKSMFCRYGSSHDEPSNRRFESFQGSWQRIDDSRAPVAVDRLIADEEWIPIRDEICRLYEVVLVMNS